MNIDFFTINLEFILDKYAPIKYQKKWTNLKKNLLVGGIEIDINDILISVKNYCKLNTNKNLPILNRCEGGLGGDSNEFDKQLRFYCDLNFLNKLNPYPNSSNSIKINIFNSSNNNNKWTLEELDDLTYAFVKTFNNIMETKCCEGKITLQNKNNNYEEDSNDENSDVE